MNMVLKVFLSMSFSGALLILVLLCGERFLKDKISRQWQYYIWLVVILRLLLPFGSEINLMGKPYQAFDRMITRSGLISESQNLPDAPEDVPAPAVDLEQNMESADSPMENLTTVHPLQDMASLLADHIWLIWLVTALGMLIRKITIYQSFIRYINAGLTPVSDMGILDQLSIITEQAGIKRPIELCVNPLISSPLLIGFFHPSIILPSADISEKNFQYIVWHELTHYKRRDMLYKWLVQVTVCLHWFNPLVYSMGREITKACEFSCDEAVMTKMGSDNGQDYGKTLLDAMAAVGKYKENLGAVTLNENKQMLKERLDAIMNFKKKSKTVWFLTGVLTLCVIFSVAFVGIYPVAAKELDGMKYPIETAGNDEGVLLQIEKYYKDGNLPLFEIAFPRLDENTQKTWLEKIYADKETAFFSCALRGLDVNSSLVSDFAQRAYADGEIAFFSVLMDYMDEMELDFWLDRALEDEKWNFQSSLLDRMDRGNEFDEQKKEMEEAQRAEYEAVGVTMNGKEYYYQGQLVNIFLDIRANKSFYTLNMNPAGTVNIKIIRDADDKIKSVSYMNEMEITELLNGMNDSDDE